MKVLVKLGGTLLDEPASLKTIAAELAQLTHTCSLVIVHGGGKQVTRYLNDRGVSSRFINGLRVSDTAVIAAVTQVIAGGVNKQLVAALIAAGCPSVGISGVDGTLTTAQPINAELQFVGQPTATDPRLLQTLLANSYTPVVACIAGDVGGNIYNVNADSMAVSCARGWQADKLLFLTDVGGVKDAAGDLIQTLDDPAVNHLIETGVAHGGMQAKLDAARLAVSSGISVHIASGSEPAAAARLLAGEVLGTTWNADRTAGAIS